VLLPVLLGVGLLTAAAAPRAETLLWVDENGVTHLSNRPEGAPSAARETSRGGVDELRAVWGKQIIGDPIRTPPGSSSSDADRAVRLLRGAVADLKRGETARASATLRSVLRTDPRRPEAHWYLALLDRQRGRYQSSEEHLRVFLSSAGNRFPEWRSSAERRLADLRDEHRLADTKTQRAPLRFVSRDNPNFRIEVDSELDELRSEYATVAVRYLEEARSDVSSLVGVVPTEPLGVVFYGKASYQREHGHRFSFQTVGFFDGRIHVSSPAHPSGELRALLYHEYAHAVFREQTGGDRPYWLNEGIAERLERYSRGQAASIRSERISLRTRLEAGQWIPLSRLAPSFSGLTDADARAAYLQSVLALGWIDARTTREERARLLKRLGEGFSIDQALYEAVGMDTAGLDAALQEEILGEFPAMRP